MEQIITKADAYNWIKKIKDTLTDHTGIVFYDKKNDPENENYFHRVSMPMMLRRFEKEINEAITFKIYNQKAQSFETLSIQYLCDYIINTDNIGMGMSLLECDNYSKTIIGMMYSHKQEYNDNFTIYEKDYIQIITSIRNTLFELRGNLILEFPNRKKEIDNSFDWSNEENEKPQTTENPNKEIACSKELLRFFSGGKSDLQDFLLKVKGASPETVIKIVNAYYKKNLIRINKNAKDNTSVKAFWQCLKDLGYYTMSYKTFNYSFGDSKKEIEIP